MTGQFLNREQAQGEKEAHQAAELEELREALKQLAFTNDVLRERGKILGGKLAIAEAERDVYWGLLQG